MNQYVFETVKPVVETKYGQIRGVTYGGVNIFMGVPYAHAERFCMPVEPESWEGIRNAYTYGPVSPQTLPPNPPSYYRGLHMLQREGENCQNLNIWAPCSLNDEKKPVFIWIHEGGYFAGNALEEYSFDGFNLAHYGDVIFVSINHRLNILGYLDLSEYGARFSNSVNAGIMDIVMALKWVHENIAAFGGDPENVTICGHSGGGGKVECMYQLEEAAPYFQRGIILSGAMKEEFDPSQDDSRQMAHAIVTELGLTEETIDEIQNIPFGELLAAYKKVGPQLREKGVITTWSPVANEYFPGFPGTVGFMPCSGEKPLIIGSVLGEFEEMLIHIDEEKKAVMTEADKVKFLLNRFGKHAERLTALFTTHRFDIPENFLTWDPTCHHDDEQVFKLADEFLADGFYFNMLTPAKLFYVWGHSYEFDQCGNWDHIEALLRKVSDREDVWYATNGEICAYVNAYRRLIFSADSSTVYNPSAVGVCLGGTFAADWVEVKPGQTANLIPPVDM